MRKLTYYLPALLLLQFCTAPVFAQNAVFLEEGSIQYERRTNGYALMQEMSEAGGLTGDKVDQYKIKNPQFRVEYFNLSFKDNKTRFEPAEANAGQPASMDEWFSLVAAGNTVYSDLSSGKRVSLKKVFGNQYEESDSIRAIKWKIADETRDIAGFHCRRADAVINDSLYIVAFYSTEIPVSGGPESLSGLPGMILGLAVPREHVTWFATKAFSGGQQMAKFFPPSGGKTMTGAQFSDIITQMTKAWSRSGTLILRKALL